MHFQEQLQHFYTVFVLKHCFKHIILLISNLPSNCKIPFRFSFQIIGDEFCYRSGDAFTSVIKFGQQWEIRNIL